MKKHFLFCLIIVVSLAIVPCAMANKLKKISLRWSDHGPPQAAGNILMKEGFVPRVNKEIAELGYELDIKYFHSGSLYKYADQVQALENGLIDFTLFVVSYELARAPLHEILGMALMGFNDTWAVSQMWFDLQETVPEFGAEFAKYKEIYHGLLIPAIINANKEIRVPGDLKGVKVQVGGIMSDVVRANGGAPVRMSPGDWYTSLDRGLIDGMFTGIYGLTMWKLHEVTKVHIRPLNDWLGLTTVSFIMNRKKYESLPAGVQKAIDKNVMWASKQLDFDDRSHDPESWEIVKKAKHKIITLTPDEMKQWYAAAKPFQDEWIEEMEAKGLPGKKVHQEAIRLYKHYAAD